MSYNEIKIYDKLMKIINVKTNQIKDIIINNCTSLTVFQENIYVDIDLKNYVYETYIISDTISQSIINEFLINNNDWVLLSTYNDWLEPTYAYRIIANIEQRDIISNQNPSLFVALNQPPANPRYQIGIFWVVYVNTFQEYADVWLKSIGCIIENRPEQL